MVLNILKEFCLDTPADTCIKREKWGRTAMQELQRCYYGSSEVAISNYTAKNTISKVFYKNESTFSIEKYSSALKEAYDTLEN